MASTSLRARWLWSVLLLLWATASAAAVGEYRTVEIESLRIEIDSEWGGRTTPGYIPIRFDITNLGEARVIDVVGQGSRFMRTSRGGAGSGSVIRQSIRLARGDRVRLTIPVPVFATSESFRFEIQEGGRTLERFNFSGFQSSVPAGEASALIVVDRSSPFEAMAAGWPREMPAGGGYYSASGVLVASGVTSTPAPSVRPAPPPGGGRPSLDFLLAPSRLPTNWLGYTSLRAVVIGPTEWEQLNEAQKSALLTWTACGGDLFLVDGVVERAPCRHAERSRGRRRSRASRVLLRPDSPPAVGIGRNHRPQTDAVRRPENPGLEPVTAGEQSGGLVGDRRTRLPPADSRHRRRAGAGLHDDPARLQFHHRAGQLLVPPAQPAAGAAGADRAAHLLDVHRAAGRLCRRGRGDRRTRPRGDVHDARRDPEAGGHACQHIAVCGGDDPVRRAAPSA